MALSRFAPRSVRGALLAGLLGTTALAGFAAGHVGLADTAPAAAPIQPTAPAQRIADFSTLVSQVKPAVLSITTELSPEAAADEEEGPQTPRVQRTLTVQQQHQAWRLLVLQMN